MRHGLLQHPYYGINGNGESTKIKRFGRFLEVFWRFLNKISGEEKLRR
jgi:hypothetical protein